MWKFIGEEERPTTWATREIAVSVAAYQEQPTKVVPVGDRFGVQLEYPDPPPKRKPVRPFTERQFTKWLNRQAGWGQQLIDDDMGCSAEDAVYDIADAYLTAPDPEAARAVAYLRNTGVRDLKGCLADYLFEVAYKPIKRR